VTKIETWELAGLGALGRIPDLRVYTARDVANEALIYSSRSCPLEEETSRYLTI
jgi:hypothetical protein